ncbi:hypothetical protein [Parabacteroides timonensis]|uniref:hypothetical protein n=1 Tax=Parabacteroides timonensis TaxID=1871013 RepID=UPI00094ED4AD|nr:hypothetical protein [Parabacteroides timonensis]
MKKEDLEKKELVSLNSELTEFSLQELEQRLETDPLAVGGLLDMASSGDMSLTNLSSSECIHCEAGMDCNIH